MKKMPVCISCSNPGFLHTLTCTAALTLLSAGLLCAQTSSNRQSTLHTEPIRYSAEFLSRQYTIDDGLPLNSVNGIAQDSLGYLYLATWEGLVRFDGYQMHVYQTMHYPELGSNRIANITLGPKNTLWLRQGANMLTTLRNNHFTMQTTKLHAEDSTTTADFGTIRHKLFDQKGAVWVSSSTGLHVKQAGAPHFERVQHPLVQGEVRYTQMLPHGDFAALTTHGLVISHRNELSVLHSSSNMAMEPHNIAGFLLNLNAGTNLRSNQPANDTNTYSLLLYGTRGFAYYQNDRMVRELSLLNINFMYNSLQESPNTILIGGREGFYRLHTDSLYLQTFENLTNSERSYRPELILRLNDGRIALIGDQGVYIDDELIGGFYDLFTGYVDRENSLWLGSHLQGLYQIRSSPIENIVGTGHAPLRNVYSVFESTDGALWAASAHSGLYRFENGQARRWNTQNNTLRLNITRFLHEDTDSTLYAGFWGGGLLRFNGKTWVDMHELNDLHNTEEFTVSSMIRDTGGRLLIGTDRHIVEKNDGDFSLIVPGRTAQSAIYSSQATHPSTQPAGSTQTGSPAPLRGNFQTMHQHPSGSLLIGTGGQGLLWLTAENDTMTIGLPDGLSSNHLRDIFVQSADTLWIATEDRGLSRVVIGQFQSDTATSDPPTDKRNSPSEHTHDQLPAPSPHPGQLPERASIRITNLNSNDGLHHNGLHRIIKDAYGTLWISSNGGIMSVSLRELNRYADGRTDNLVVTLFDEHSGMGNREANGGVQHSGSLTRDGRILFANQSGITIIHPERFQHIDQTVSGFMPEVLIETVRSDERTIDVSHAGAPALNRSGTLMLNRSERNLRVRFTAPNFANPERLSFRYRLHGNDSRWQQTEHPIEAVYTNLSPGSYQFEVQAVDMNGEQRSALLNITVPAYFHETFIFYLLLLFATAGLLGLLVLWRLRNLHRWKRIQQLIDTQTREIKRAAEERGRFFSGITHELKTPLSLILGPVDELIEQRQQAESGNGASTQVDGNGGQGKVFGGHSQMISSRVDGNGGQGKGAHTDLSQLLLIRRSSQRMLDLVRQMLEISRLSSHSFQLSCQPVDLPALTREITAQFGELIAKKNLRLVWEQALARPMPQARPDNTCYVDHSAWERIVMNLLSNAIKHSPEGGTITLGFSRQANGEPGWEHALTFIVRDQGTGIPEEERARVFDYLFQGASGNRIEGSGIGLYLVKLLVERMGGRVLASGNLPKGAAFEVTLRAGKKHLATDDLAATDDMVDSSSVCLPEEHWPASDSNHLQPAQLGQVQSRAQAPSQTPALPTSQASGQTPASAMAEASEMPPSQAPDNTHAPLKILIVEDSEEYRDFLATQLSQYYTMQWVSSGDEALQVLSKWRADLVITDVVMPGMSGLTLVARLRLNEHLRHLPVIILSGQDQHTDIQRGLGSGADVYLTKPIGKDVLVSQINALTRRERLLAEGAVAKHETHPDHSLVARVHELVYRHMANPALNPELLADALFMSRSALYREWAKENSTTLKRFIRSVRLEEASFLLRDRKYSVQQAAMATGYADPSYFSTAFKKVYGVSPGEWRSTTEPAK